MRVHPQCTPANTTIRQITSNTTNKRDNLTTRTTTILWKASKQPQKEKYTNKQTTIQHTYELF